MKEQPDWIVVGRFGRPHGIKGFVTVHSFTEPRENILKYTNWHAFIDKKWRPIELLNIEVHTKAILAMIKGYEQRELAAHLTHVDIGIQKNQLEALDPGEYYWHQLMGMSVLSKDGQLFGTVSEILPTGSNDVLIVEGERKHLIPYLPDEVIIHVDLIQKIITVDWDMDF